MSSVLAFGNVSHPGLPAQVAVGTVLYLLHCHLAVAAIPEHGIVRHDDALGRAQNMSMHLPCKWNAPLTWSTEPAL